MNDMAPPAGMGSGQMLAAMGGANIGGDPAEAFLAMIKSTQGFAGQNIPSLFASGGPSLGLPKVQFGLFGAMFDPVKRHFISMSEFASSIVGESGIQTPDLAPLPVEPAQMMEAAHQIASVPVESAPITPPSILSDVAQVEAPKLSAPEIAAATTIRAPSA